MSQQTLFDTPASGAAASSPAAVVCDRCGFNRFVDVPIHDGRSTRRDCARCKVTAGFPVWYGREQALAPTHGTRAAAATAIAPMKPNMLRQVLAFIASRGHAGATDEEIAVALRMRESTARARRVDLRDGGQVCDSGRRRKTRSGRLAVVWTATGKPLD